MTSKIIELTRKEFNLIAKNRGIFKNLKICLLENY